MAEFQYSLPVVDSGGPEKHQGIYREQFLGVWEGGETAYLVLLGYLVQCWAKLHHQSGTRQGDTRSGVRGEGFIDTTTSSQFKNWQCSHALVEITHVPDSIDMVFGTNPNVYVGRCAFFQSALADNAKDWTLQGPKIGLGFFGGASFQSPQAARPQSFQDLRGDLAARARSQGLILQGQIQENNILAPNTYQAATGVQFWGSIPLGKSPQVQTQRGVGGRWYYPLEWINFRHNIFVVPNPNASGFWWHLKPGVVANITLFGLQQEPGVSYGGGESGHASFNPLDGGPT
jgi:hypothetical protein